MVPSWLPMPDILTSGSWFGNLGTWVIEGVKLQLLPLGAVHSLPSWALWEKELLSSLKWQMHIHEEMCIWVMHTELSQGRDVLKRI